MRRPPPRRGQDRRQSRLRRDQSWGARRAGDLDPGAPTARTVPLGGVSIIVRSALPKREGHEVPPRQLSKTLLETTGEERGHSGLDVSGASPNLCNALPEAWRSEERRVGKECRSRWSRY